MAQRSRLAILIALAVGLLSLGILTLRHLQNKPSPQIPVTLPPPSSQSSGSFPGYSGAECPTSAPWLTTLRIPRPFKYSRRDIIVRAKPDLKRASITKLDNPLFPDFETITEDNTESQVTKCSPPLHLDVPAYPSTYPNASHLTFGIATSLSRLENSIAYLERWLPYTQARLLVLVNGEDPENSPGDPVGMREMEARLRGMGIDATLIPPFKPDDPMDFRYFSLLKALYLHRSPQTTWGIVVDDDAFFPSLPGLIKELERHDHTEQLYLGAMSEEWWTVNRYSFMGLGGAGIILSIPLLAHLAPHHDECLGESRANAGDIRIYECVKWHSDVRLTQIDGLYQSDILGDRSGFYESGRRMLSLHHWKMGWWDEDQLGTQRPSGIWYPMHTMHLVADVCGECFLQRWQFGNDTILSNGYSISAYPTGALQGFDKHRGLEKMERTWLPAGMVEGSLNEGHEHYLGITRPMLELEREKVQWRFLDSWREAGGIRVFYHHFGEEGEMDEVVELFWIRDDVWNEGIKGQARVPA